MPGALLQMPFVHFSPLKYAAHYRLLFQEYYVFVFSGSSTVVAYLMPGASTKNKENKALLLEVCFPLQTIISIIFPPYTFAFN